MSVSEQKLCKQTFAGSDTGICRKKNPMLEWTDELVLLPPSSHSDLHLNSVLSHFERNVWMLVISLSLSLENDIPHLKTILLSTV